MKRIALILLGLAALYFLYHVGQGFMDAGRHGGSPAARERRLAAISKDQNIGLPRDYGEGTIMVTTKAGPGLRFTYVIQLSKFTRADVDIAALAANGKDKLMEIYRTTPELANFRKWEVELCWQYLDKDGNDIATIAVTPNEL
jgi:hypothetical protein